MKKRIFTIIFSLTMFLSVFSVTAWGDTEIAINETNFPDAVFREYVAETFDGTVEEPKDGKLSEAEIAEATGIYVRGKGISDLTGIQYFTALEMLDCGENDLTTLNIASNTNLKTLRCDQNKLTGLNVSSNTALIELNCSVNTALCGLNVMNNTALEVLNCQTTGISVLDVSANTELIELICAGNPLELLDVSNCLNLECLICPATYISELDVSANIALTELVCEENAYLTSLNVSSNTALVHLNCTTCNLTELDVSNCPNLEELLFAQNSLTTINLSNNHNLNWIECDFNKLIELDVSGCPLLECLECGQNKLTKLDVSKNTALVQLICPFNYLTELNLSGLSNLCELICDYNNLTKLDIRPTQCCVDKDNTGYFGNQSSNITVFMTAAQKACFDVYYADNSRNEGVTVVVEQSQNNVPTGDDSQIVLWGSLLLILGAAITVVALKLRRKED